MAMNTTVTVPPIISHHTMSLNTVKVTSPTTRLHGTTLEHKVYKYHILEMPMAMNLLAG